MNYSELVNKIKSKKNFLCVGLDPDPKNIKDDKILDFNKKIIDETYDLCIAYKPNIAFYEHLGIKGWCILEKTLDYIGKDHFTIADAKRADIGNTSKFYAKTFFETYNFDSITLNPFMGKDSIDPFMEWENKWSIILALTSNDGSSDFQTPDLYKSVLQKTKDWGTKENTMYVVGATKSDFLQEVRSIIPDHFMLIPGVGAQGGSLDEVCQNAMTKDCGLIINSSRSIIFAEKPRLEAQKLKNQMQIWIEKIML